MKVESNHFQDDSHVPLAEEILMVAPLTWHVRLADPQHCARRAAELREFQGWTH
jgi:hypothetical protein